MKKSIGKVIAGAAGTLILLQTMLTGPAAAHPGADGWCIGYGQPTGEMCLFRLTNYVDMQADYYYPDSDFTDDHLWFWDGDEYIMGAETVDNRASSARNMSSICTVRLHQLVGQGGNIIEFPPMAASADLGAYDFDNRASSISWPDCI
ncbi:hypothetical protein AB0G05_42755 [Nonomuraea wenchangensis]